MLRPASAATAALLALAVAGCNRPPPPVVIAPPEGGCAVYIPQFRGQVDGDAAAGKLDRATYSRALQDLSQAETACSAGREAQARLIYLSTRHTYGYPQPGGG